MNLPEMFSINLSQDYASYLDHNNGNYGEKAAIIRLALRTQLPKLNPVSFALALRRIRGPFTRKVNIVPNSSWWSALDNKAQELETSIRVVARVALCLFLEEVAKAEGIEI